MTAITDAVLADAERIVVGYRNGRIKQHSLAWELYLGNAYVQLAADIEAAFQDACTAHMVWQDAESPEGGRDVPDTDPLTHAENCRTLLVEALARLVHAVDTYTAALTSARSAA